MNYSRIYDAIIERRKATKFEGYAETHHIVPRCLGGTNDPENLVSLSAREHWLCHMLLWKMHPGNAKLAGAAWMMCHVKSEGQERYIPARVFQKLKEAAGVRSQETRHKLSQAKKGIKLSEEHRRKISEAGKGRASPNKGKILPDEWRANMAAAQRGRTHSEETKQKLRTARAKQTISDETRQRMSEAAKRRCERKKAGIV